MDFDGENIKKCFRLPHTLFESLNVVHNSSTLMTVFWNKYQLFVYDDFHYEGSAKIFEPEFSISKLLLTDNYLICLDYSGNVHTVPLKFKNSAQKRFKSSFQPREQNVISMDCWANFTYTLKYTNDTYYILKHKNSHDFQLEQQVALKMSKTYITNEKQTCLFRTYATSESEFEQIKGFFNMAKILWKQHILFLISPDRLSLYACLFSNNYADNSIELVKVYCCPSYMTDINVVMLDQLSILIGLTIGTVIRIPINSSANVHIVHLNTAIHKILTKNVLIFYTDGITFWNSENTFTKDVTFQQLFAKHVKDFVFVGDKILCTTYSNLIYLFTNESDGSFIKPVTDKYCPADSVLSNSDCLDKIMEEIEESNEIISNINKKKNYITTLALSNRQDVMDSLICYNVSVFENFREIQEENVLSLTDDLKEYYDANSHYFLIKITSNTLENKLNEILPNIIGDLKIHITLKTKKNILKTISLSFNGQKKKINLVIPIKSTPPNTLNKVHIFVKLIANIPGIFDSKQCVWAILHKRHVVLNAEHFIKDYAQNTNIQHLNPVVESIDDLIIKTTINHYGHLLKFNKITTKESKVWSLFLKLPDKYEELFKNGTFLKENLTAPKTEVLVKLITTKEFLKLEREFYLDIGEDRVKLQIKNDGITKPLLKTSCENLETALDIKNFFSNFIYNYFKEFQPAMEFVDQALYSTIENLEKSIRDCLKSELSNTQEFINLYNHYQVVISSLYI